MNHRLISYKESDLAFIPLFFRNGSITQTSSKIQGSLIIQKFSDVKYKIRPTLNDKVVENLICVSRLKSHFSRHNLKVKTSI